MFVLAILLAATPPSIAVPGVSCVRMEQRLCESFVDRLVATLSERGKVKVVSERDISLLLGLERQRQLLGCANESTSCLAELSGALGVDGVAAISIARSDPYFVTTVRVVRARDGSVWANATERVTREGEIFDSMDTIAPRLERAMLGEAAAPEVTRSSTSSIAPWIPGGAGIAAASIGLGVFLSAGTERQQLVTHQVSGTAADAAAQTGRTKEGVGVALMATGGAAVAASVVWLLAGRPPAAVAVLPTNGGVSVGVAGALP